jgi:hypothetical protein
MKRPDLLILVAVWQFITAFGALIGITAISVFAFPDAVGRWGMPDVGAIFGLSIAILLLLCYMGAAVAGGIGLFMGKEWGRITSIAHAAITVIWVPIGTVIGILTIVYLVKSDVKEYFIPTS